ncbi:putative syntaxin-131 [Platanthera guangdongensis]|uniref:Syntaxin-131 n=1 Tax=Platanthera guangdongensis TaxID=2320717 RepID=A0ABR2M1F3_9ASPA
MNWQESFERIKGRYPGESDIESGDISPENNASMNGFFMQVDGIEKQIEQITTQLGKLQAANEECQQVTTASAMHEIKKQMDKEMDQVKKIAHNVKRNLEELDKDNIDNRKKHNCGKGTGIDRSRIALTV